MFRRFTWLGIGLCAAVSFGGNSSYGSSIDFGSCAQIVTPGVVCPSADATKSQNHLFEWGPVGNGHGPF
jgi:hypothetical protein